jgi:hypothetical protein
MPRNLTVLLPRGEGRLGVVQLSLTFNSSHILREAVRGTHSRSCVRSHQLRTICFYNVSLLYARVALIIMQVAEHDKLCLHGCFLCA